jgi:hypothetical protein
LRSSAQQVSRTFFQELSELLTTTDSPEVAEIAALAANYGLQFGEPAWLPDVISRYRLTPPPE